MKEIRTSYLKALNGEVEILNIDFPSELDNDIVFKTLIALRILVGLFLVFGVTALFIRVFILYIPFNSILCSIFFSFINLYFSIV